MMRSDDGGRCAGRLKSVATALAIGAAAPAVAAVPVTMMHGYPMVPVEIMGRQHAFVLDTGAEGSAVYPGFAGELALPAASGETLIGQTGEADLRTRTIASLMLDGRRAGPIAATELPARADGLPLAGIIGLDVIDGRLLDLDVSRGRMALLDGGAAARAVRRLGAPVRATRLTGGLLAVPVMLDGVAGTAVIDTGARETRVNGVFARAARLATVDRPATSVSGATQRPMAVATAKVREAGFLGRERRNTTVRVVDLPVFEVFGLGERPAMLLGIDWLGAHRLLIDFRNGLVWLQ